MLSGEYVNSHVCEEFLIDEVTEGVASNGKPFVKLKISNKKGSANGVIWSFSGNSNGLLSVGKVVIITGTIKLYNNDHSITINSFEEGISSPEDYIRKSTIDTSRALCYIRSLICEMSEPITKAATMRVFDFFEDDLLCKAPAASSVHNNWRGGLVEHIYSMVSIAKEIVAHYKDMYYSKLSKDKVIFGVIAHDICKIMEYDVNNVKFPKTTTGVLVNHIVFGPAIVYKVLMDYFKEGNVIPNEKDMKEVYELMHIVASHHGKIEWGSPVVPATLEAILVHHIDNMDSKFMHAFELMKEVDPTNKELSRYSRFENTNFVLKGD